MENTGNSQSLDTHDEYAQPLLLQLEELRHCQITEIFIHTQETAVSSASDVFGPRRGETRAIARTVQLSVEPLHTSYPKYLDMNKTRIESIFKK